MSRSSIFPRLFKQNSTQIRLIAQARPVCALKPSFISKFSAQQRFIHSSPKEYNGLESAAYHFKRQQHMPYFMEYLMWVVFGSEALHLIWLKMDYKEYKEKMKLKTRLLEEIIERVENGEKIDDSLREEIKMVLMNNKHGSEYHDDIDDEYLNSLIESSEQAAVKEKVEKAKKPVVESKWVEVKEEEVAEGEKPKKKKEPFFL